MIKHIIILLSFPVVGFIICLLMDILFQWINKNEQGSIFYKEDKNVKSNTNHNT